MELAYKIVDYALSFGTDLVIFIIYFLSIKKCFWKEGMSKVGIFFLSFFTFPIPWYVISITICSFFGVYLPVFFITGSVDFFETPNYFFLVTCISAIFFPIIILLISFIGTLCLKINIKNMAQFMFLYLMTWVVSLSSIKAEAIGTVFSIPNLGYVLNLINIIINLLAVWFFYRLIVFKFSDLLKENVRINWKLFIIAPMAFSLFYSAIASFLSMNLSGNDEIAFVSMIFSTMIEYIFIWAFYVILKNMIATNEAIKAKDEIKTLSVEVMEALAHTIDAKDEYTKGHSVRVAKYSRMLAEKLGLNEGDCESVYYMALLHDIGKIGVPNEIINSKSKMTDEEYAIMKTHPAIGSDILEEIKSRPDLMIGARWQHERYDGKGYPHQKAGEDIPYFARIISVADSYDAMTSNRSYRKFLPQDVVRGEIEKNCGTQFDPNVAKCMLSIIDEDVNYEYHE